VLHGDNTIISRDRGTLSDVRKAEIRRKVKVGYRKEVPVCLRASRLRRRAGAARTGARGADCVCWCADEGRGTGTGVRGEGKGRGGKTESEWHELRGAPNRKQMQTSCERHGISSYEARSKE